MPIHRRLWSWLYDRSSIIGDPIISWSYPHLPSPGKVRFCSCGNGLGWVTHPTILNVEIGFLYYLVTRIVELTRFILFMKVYPPYRAKVWCDWSDSICGISLTAAACYDHWGRGHCQGRIETTRTRPLGVRLYPELHSIAAIYVPQVHKPCLTVNLEPVSNLQLRYRNETWWMLRAPRIDIAVVDGEH